MSVSLTYGRHLSLENPLAIAPSPLEGSGIGLAEVAQWDRVIDELLRFRSLEADWDGQGATAPNAAIVDHALTWVREMRRWPQAVPPTGVVPGTTGELVLEWRGNGVYFAAELSSPDRVDWLLDVPGQGIQQWQTDAGRVWILRSEK